MKNQIKKGDDIRIKDSLMDELVRCGFNKEEMIPFVRSWKGKTCKALDVYQDADEINGSNEWYVTVDVCCEIPIEACEVVEDEY